MTSAWTCAHGHGMTPPRRSWQDISIAYTILIEFEATEYSYSIQIRNLEDIRFQWNSWFVPFLLVKSMKTELSTSSLSIPLSQPSDQNAIDKVYISLYSCPE